MNSSHLQNIKLAIFDFDGTIADSSEGILDAHKFALASLGLKIPSNTILKSLIGKNLLSAYVSTFKLEENKATEAVAIYRRRYADFGVHEATLYPKFAGMLKHLKEDNFMLGVATLKLEKFAVEMLKELDIYNYFDVVRGMSFGDNISKAELISKCVNYCECKCREAVMIGDSESDFIGAKEANVEFIGVTYGFGFKPDNQYDFITANRPDEILSLLLRKQ